MDTGAQASENLSRYIKEMKVWLYGDPGEASAKEDTIPVRKDTGGLVSLGSGHRAHPLANSFAGAHH